MALRTVTCHACAEQIPWHARICPHCDEPRDRGTRPLALIALGILLMVGLAKAEPYLAPLLVRLARDAGIVDPPEETALGTGGRVDGDASGRPVSTIAEVLGAVACLSTDELTGSGVIVSPEGHILTSSAMAGPTHASVLVPKRRVPFGEVVRPDFNAVRLAVVPEIGLGLMKVGDRQWKAPHVEIGDATKLRAADPIVVVGFPLESRAAVVTKGVVSAAPTFLPGLDLPLIQFDAAVNAGHSGGALLDAELRLVGIVAARIPGAEGMGYAIPVNYAARLASSATRLTLRKLPSMEAWVKARPKEKDTSHLAGAITIRIVGAIRRDAGLVVFLGASDDLGVRQAPTAVTVWAEFEGGSCVATAGEDVVDGDQAADLARENRVPADDPLLAIPFDCPRLPRAGAVRLRALAQGVRKPASFTLP